VDRLIRDDHGRPVLIAMPERMRLMEAASNTLWEVLKRLSLQQLMSLEPTGGFIALIDALIDCRQLMGEDPPTAAEIEDLQRRHLLYRA
jgi:hypothetical protein